MSYHESKRIQSNLESQVRTHPLCANLKRTATLWVVVTTGGIEHRASHGTGGHIWALSHLLTKLSSNT